MRQGIAISLVIAALLLGSAAFLSRYGVANVIGSGMAFTEKSAVSTLRTLHWAQGDFRKGAFVDADGDGHGEFGTLEQLAAVEPLPSGRLLPASLVPTAGTRLANGVLAAGGYCFRVELPEGADARERRFTAMAWPMTRAAGQKIFCLDQNEEIFESPNPAGWTGCDAPPPPGVCPDPAEAEAAGWARWRGKTRRNPVGLVD